MSRKRIKCFSLGLQVRDLRVEGQLSPPEPSHRLLEDARRQVLAHQSRLPISCIPNAGLPSVIDGEMVYDLTADQLADHLERYISELGVSVVGGCCGTTPAHIAAVAERCADLTPAQRSPVHEAAATSIYSRGDGINSWRYCLDREGPLSENVRVYGSHCGLAVNPMVYFVLADRLGELH